ncbi:MAG: DUF896 domain-containing protein [Clostridiales bacterium]|nr:DUF896 domain-containing protein [Clostridiales bacterium]
MTQEKIDRINALARKAKTPEGLTAAEKAEQAALRQEYVAAVRTSLRGQLDNTYVVDAQGNKVSVREANRQAKEQGKPGVKIKLK